MVVDEVIMQDVILMTAVDHNKVSKELEKEVLGQDGCAIVLTGREKESSDLKTFQLRPIGWLPFPVNHMAVKCNYRLFANDLSCEGPWEDKEIILIYKIYPATDDPIKAFLTESMPETIPDAKSLGEIFYS